MNFAKSAVLVGALFLFSDRALSKVQADPPSFKYSLELDSAGYRFQSHFSFSPLHSFADVTAALRDPASMSRANPGLMRPNEIANLRASMFDSWTIFNFFNGSRFKRLVSYFDFRMLSHCKESIDLKSQKFDRECVYDPNVGNARWFTREKTDHVTCQREANSQRVSCRLDVKGDVRALPLISHEKMNLRAKRKALENWVRLWISIEGFELETNQVAEKIQLKSSLDRLEASADLNHPRFEAQGSFLFP